MRVSSVLFADVTTIIGKSGEMESGVGKVKEVVNKWEETNNEDKEERLVFGTRKGKEIRMLGSWVVAEADCRNSCLLYTSPSPRDKRQSRMPSSA